MTTLEKIRAEIEQTTGNYNPASDAYDGGYVMAIRDVLQIIDKYAEQEPCDDVVSRQAVYEILDGNWNTDFLHSEVEQLPSVQPEPKTGHWIEHPEIETSEPEYLMFYECSECGDEQCFCKSDVHKKRFCSNCGAKMVEPQESEDKG